MNFLELSAFQAGIQQDARSVFTGGECRLENTYQQSLLENTELCESPSAAEVKDLVKVVTPLAFLTEGFWAAISSCLHCVSD